MDDSVIQDLKQFIATTVSQQTSSLATKEDINALDDKLLKMLDDLSNSVTDAIDSTSESTDSQLTDHEVRIAKLEQKAV